MFLTAKVLFFLVFRRILSVFIPFCRHFTYLHLSLGSAVCQRHECDVVFQRVLTVPVSEDFRELGAGFPVGLLGGQQGCGKSAHMHVHDSVEPVLRP